MNYYKIAFCGDVDLLNVDKLYERPHDLPYRESGAEQTYMVASIPRSGSTYFVLRLWAAGAFGAPLEYLNMNTNRPIYQRLGLENLWNYWTEIQKIRTGANGVFGYKMFVPNYREVSQNEVEFLKRITPDHVIYFTREDKISQAVSYARAIQTKRWFAIAKEQSPPEYDFDLIKKQENSVLTQELAWEKIFEITNTNPLRVGYSEVLNDEDKVIRRIANFIGVEYAADARREIAFLDRQSDAINEEWVERYRAEKQSRDMEQLQTTA